MSNSGWEIKAIWTIEYGCREHNGWDGQGYISLKLCQLLLCSASMWLERHCVPVGSGIHSIWYCTGHIFYCIFLKNCRIDELPFHGFGVSWLPTEKASGLKIWSEYVLCFLLIYNGSLSDSRASITLTDPSTQQYIIHHYYSTFKVSLNAHFRSTLKQRTTFLVSFCIFVLNFEYLKLQLLLT